MAVVSVVFVLCLFGPCLPAAFASQAAETERPVFTEEPSDSLNVIAKSAFVKCKTKHALDAWFECSEDARFIEKKQTASNYVDPSDGVRHIELQLEVKRVQNPVRSSFLSEDPLGPMFLVECWCYAYGGHQNIISRKASLQFSNTPSVPEPPSPSPPVVSSPKSVDGAWSSWSLWSVCSHECQQVKRRSCTNPSPKHGGSYCTGADFHMRNCTGGMCRKLDLYRKEKGDSTFALGFDVYLFALVSTAIFLILSALFLLFLVRRRKFTKPGPTVLESAPEGHSIHVLLQQHSSSLLHQPDLIRGGGGDKMQLISRLNNLDSNVLEHLIVRKEHLPYEGNPLARLHNNCSASNTDNSTSGESEPDYAEPVITNSPFCTPERRPPLPRSIPPVHGDKWTKNSFPSHK